MTTVTNTKTHQEREYELLPGEAVIKAWEEDNPGREAPELEFGRYVVTCGDWKALVSEEAHRARQEHGIA